MFKGLVFGALIALCNVASAFDFVDNTYLVEIKQGGMLSDHAYSLRGLGFESATGDRVSFDKWYKPKGHVDSHFMFMTKASDNLGVMWGFSTGEKGEKYTIDPSVKIGAVYLAQLTKTSTLTLRGAYTFGGKFREKSCTADYGDVGGVQQVNCRLAATPMQPSETLNYMLNERPRDYKTISIQYTWNF